MAKTGLCLLLVAMFAVPTFSQKTAPEDFRLALPNHPGQLRWSAEGFKVIESSAKPGGNEIGIRGKDDSGRLVFLGFLFMFSEQAPLTSANCRDGVIEPEKKVNPSLKILNTTEIAKASGPPLSMVTYTERDKSGKDAYSVRGFVAAADVCGDLEVYSSTPITPEDPDVKKIFSSYQLDEHYVSKLQDVFLYAQILYNAHMYKAAGPIYEIALAKVGEAPGNSKTMIRVLTDQAGMSYGMSGDISKARALFEKGIAEDPDYPLYYYNLACADAEEKNLTGARKHLQEAFARKANVVPGEKMPNPSLDDSFVPYRHNKEFWAFIETLRP
jgi:hypothetical protein